MKNETNGSKKNLKILYNNITEKYSHAKTGEKLAEKLGIKSSRFRNKKISENALEEIEKAKKKDRSGKR